ncbi:MAG: hypothetical protein FJW95_05930 [Actinobacteria bacterium]|nr:hypothetical protein [Actinomycetota bacterium]
MVFALAAVATVLACLFAMATFQRAAAGRGPHQWAWTVALVLFAAASVALALGASTGWDDGTYKVFYLCGAIASVPWLALGTVFLLFGGPVGRRARGWLVFFSGLSLGAILLAQMEPVTGTEIPVGKDTFTQALPRVLAAVASGLGATVIVVGALWSLVRLLGADVAGRGRLAGANALVATGTLVLSSGGLLQGFVGHDEAFALSLAVGIAVIYAGFLVADGAPLPAPEPEYSHSE